MKWIKDFYEPITRTYFKAPISIVNSRINEFNKLLKNKSISMNDALELCGLPRLDDSRADKKLNVSRVEVGLPKIGKERGYYYYPIVYYDRENQEVKLG